MTTIPLELKLPEDQVKLLAEIAKARQAEIETVLENIVMEWLERETKLSRARQIFAQFSKGIGSSQPPHDAAVRHDAHLYGKT